MAERGWNFKKGAKDAPDIQELRNRASKGGSVSNISKGFAANKEAQREALKKSIEVRRNKRAESFQSGLHSGLDGNQESGSISEEAQS